jgi:hypothetical protein
MGTCLVGAINVLATGVSAELQGAAPRFALVDGSSRLFVLCFPVCVCRLSVRTAVCVYLMERAGRRKLMTWGVIGMFFSAILLTVCLVVKSDEVSG